MEDAFLIRISLEGKEYEFETKILWLGFQHKIEVNIEGIVVLFEPDEERNYRAIFSPEQTELHQSVPKKLLKAVAQHLESILKS